MNNRGVTSKKPGNASETHYPASRRACSRKARVKALAPRVCACGCGESFRPTRAWQRFVDPKHRTEAWECSHRDKSLLPKTVKKLRDHEARIRAIEARLEMKGA